MARTSTLERDALLPKRPGGLGRGALLALLAHGILILGLTLMLNWRVQEPEGISAELWAAIPQQAAPPAPEVNPEPKAQPPAQPVQTPPQRDDAQIALEKAERERKERQRAEELEREKKEKERIEKEKELERQKEQQRKIEEERLAKVREQNLKRMLGQAGATGVPDAAGTAARDAGPSAGYAGRIKARIKPNIVFTDEVTGNPTAEVEVRCAPDGTIIGRRILKASGNTAWDDAVLRAIERTEVLPRDIDGRVPSPMIVTFKLRE